SDRVAGTFAGLPEGATFVAGGQTFQISYTGGDGNDVALTAIPLSVSPATPPAAAVGTSYSQQLTGSGGSGSGYIYSATGLPPGLSIDADGLIIGILTTVSGSPFGATVTITDGEGHSRDVALTMTGVAGASTTSLASSASPTVVGQTFTLTATISAARAG